VGERGTWQARLQERRTRQPFCHSLHDVHLLRCPRGCRHAPKPRIGWQCGVLVDIKPGAESCDSDIHGVRAGVAYLAERYGDQREAVSLEQDLPPEAEALKGSLLTRWGREFMALAIKLLPEYLILVLLLGATRAWLFPVLGAHDGLFWIVAMAVAGTLFVIPTAGEVPIVQAMFALGMGAGPAGALIMTLPAVSLPSLAMLSRTFSLRTRLVIVAGVVLSGIAGGLIAMIAF